MVLVFLFFFSSRRRHTRYWRDWSSDVCSSDLLTESVSNAGFGIYMPRFSGTIYEVLSAPIAVSEIVLGYVGAAATKSVILGAIILCTARLFVAFSVAHPVWMMVF